MEFGRAARANSPRLDALKLRYQALEKNRAPAKLMVTGPFACEIVLRGDYDPPGFVVEMENVGRYGASRLRIGAEELTDDALDELDTCCSAQTRHSGASWIANQG